MKRMLLLLAFTFGASPVWAVQTCPSQLARVAPNSRYIDHPDGTLTDTFTGLMWKKCTEGLSGAQCETGTASLNIWEPALQAASNSTFAGYDDWRLPNLPELSSLIETGCHSPAINDVQFPGTVEGAWYLSSTVNHLSGNVHGILFGNGSEGYLSREFFGLSRHVRPVGTTLSAPRNLAATSGNAQNSLSWSSPVSNGGSAITSYRVFRGTTSTNQQLVTIGGCASLTLVTTCTDTGLINGQSYFYTVSAVNGIGQGPSSNQVSATPGAAAGCNGPVYAIASAPGSNATELYVGGQFTSCGGVAAVNIARLSGATWSALGSGFGTAADQVEAIVVSGAEVTVGGIRGSGVSRVARWSGSSWQTLGSLTTGVVNRLRWYHVPGRGPTLFVGGSSPIGLQYWDGTAWQLVGGGVQGAVNDIATLGNDLIVAGTFSTVGGSVSASHLARWNGTSWSALGGFNGAVNAVAVVGDRLFVAGTFTSIGAVSANRFAELSGSTWTALGVGVGDIPVALGANGNEVFIGGSFTAAGGLTVNRLIRWNTLTQQWMAVPGGNGANANVFSLLVDRDKLWIGGAFTVALGETVEHLASYTLNSQCVAAPAGMRSWFRAESVSDSLTGTAGQLLGGATIVDDGRAGKAFRFDGVDDYFQIDPSTALPASTGDRTVEFWFKPEDSITPADPLSHFLISRGAQSVDTANGGGNLEIIGLNPRPYSSYVTLNAGVWHHLAITSGGLFTTMYLDGEYAGGCANCGAPLFGENLAMRIGWDTSRPVNFGFKGRIDEISFYDRALATPEVSAVVKAGASGKCPGAIASPRQEN